MKHRRMAPVFCVVVLVFAAVALAPAAQRPTRAADASVADAKAVPRTPDGKPDLSGTWVGGAQTEGGEFAVQVGGNGTMELTKWGLEKFRWNRGPETANAAGVYRGQHVRLEYDPLYHCYPPGLVRLGPPAMIIGGGSRTTAVLVEILQTPSQVAIVFQYRNAVRFIYTDGREHPKNLELTWNGHSIGKWDGDTLVVDTMGLRDESWLDTGGHEHSPELHVVERFRRVALDRLEIERTLTDPVALAKPFTTKVALRLRPDLDLNENMDGRQYDCTQFMVRKPAFGEGENGLLGISDPP